MLTTSYWNHSATPTSRVTKRQEEFRVKQSRVGAAAHPERQRERFLGLDLERPA